MLNLKDAVCRLAIRSYICKYTTSCCSTVTQNVIMIGIVCIILLLDFAAKAMIFRSWSLNKYLILQKFVTCYAWGWCWNLSLGKNRDIPRSKKIAEKELFATKSYKFNPRSYAEPGQQFYLQFWLDAPAVHCFELNFSSCAIAFCQLCLALRANWLVTEVLHCELPFTLSHAPQSCAVAEHVTERHLCNTREMGGEL